MGLNADLKLVGNDFNNAASWMYIANLIAEFPTGKLPDFPVYQLC
jgi:hypothetical protein